MKQIFILILATSLLFAGSDALARDTLHQYSIADVMGKPENANRLEGVSFYFGEQDHPPIKKITVNSTPTRKPTHSVRVTSKHASG